MSRDTDAPIDLAIDYDEIERTKKNTDGTAGAKCDQCGGFGFTIPILEGGATATCKTCAGSGVATMTVQEEIAELRGVVVALGRELAEWRALVLKYAPSDGDMTDE